MTKIEAIKYLEEEVKLREVFHDKAIEALDMAIKALEHEQEEEGLKWKCRELPKAEST